MEIQVLKTKHTSGMTHGWETVWIVLARGFLKSFALTDFWLRFIHFWRALRRLFQQKSLGTITNWVRRKFNFPVICIGVWRRHAGQNRLYKHCHYFRIFAISTIQNQAAGNISMCVLEEKLDFLKEILQGTYNSVYKHQLCGDGQQINEFH